MGALKALVIGMGVLIVAGTVTLVTLLVQRVGGTAAPRWEAALAQPEGSRIAGIAATESGIAVWLTRPGGDGTGDRVLVVDPKRGKIIGEIRPGRE